MSMDQDLARMFGTDKLASQDQQKLAALDHFAKVASIAGIEFQTDEQATAWVNTWDDFQKLAYGNNIALHEYGVEKQAEMFVDWYNRSVEEVSQSQEQRKVAEAANYLQKIASETASTQRQFEAAAQFGKIAAHAYVSEITGLMKGAEQKLRPEEVKSTREVGQKLEDTLAGSKHKAPSPPDHQPNSAWDPKPDRQPTEEKVKARVGGGLPYRESDDRNKRELATREVKGRVEEVRDKAQRLWDHKHRNKALLGAGAVLALAGGAYGAKKIYDKKKEEGEGKEAFDLLAAKEAHAILVNEGFDGNEAAERLNLALQKEALELTSDEVKLAAAQNPEYGLLTRAVELMEIAGYGVAGL